MNEKLLVIITSVVLLSSYLVLAPILKAIYGYQGLPMAASLAFMISLVALIACMWKKHPDFYWKTNRQKLPSPATST